MAIAFTKVKLPFGWLGNMSPYRVLHDGKWWQTTEALFQALRFKPDCPDQIQTQIIKAAGPMNAKFVAKAWKHKMIVEPMSEQDVANMEMVLRLKLKQHPELCKWLLATGNEEIIEDVTSRSSSGNHRFWGAALVDGNWVGTNTLGELWMKLRRELKEQEDAKAFVRGGE